MKLNDRFGSNDSQSSLPKGLHIPGMPEPVVVEVPLKDGDLPGPDALGKLLHKAITEAKAKADAQRAEKVKGLPDAITKLLDEALKLAQANGDDTMEAEGIPEFGFPATYTKILPRAFLSSFLKQARAMGMYVDKMHETKEVDGVTMQRVSAVMVGCIDKEGSKHFVLGGVRLAEEDQWACTLSKELFVIKNGKDEGHFVILLDQEKCLKLGLKKITEQDI